MKHLTNPYFTAGVASRLVGISPTTLRNWERRGLISPLREGRARRRLYTWRDIERAQRIRYLVIRKHLPLRAVKVQLRVPAPRISLAADGGRDSRRGAPLFPRLTLAFPR